MPALLFPHFPRASIHHLQNRLAEGDAVVAVDQKRPISGVGDESKLNQHRGTPGEPEHGQVGALLHSPVPETRHLDEFVLESVCKRLILPRVPIQHLQPVCLGGRG